ALFEQGRHSIVLDGDALRGGLNKDLGFADSDRLENIRRASELAALLVENGQIVVLAMIAPLVELRAVFAERLGADYREVWCSASLAVCEGRDPKGHYARARKGELPGFTGIGSPYEPPPHASLELDTGVLSAQQCVERLLGWLAPGLDSGEPSF
ncbi:MAG TPA: adenylyl-sulfate kinase, partial [Pseudomonas sp.]|nr:adenylyl-sulfate kinase [Pseudomonas sp.]